MVHAPLCYRVTLDRLVLPERFLEVEFSSSWDHYLVEVSALVLETPMNQANRKMELECLVLVSLGVDVDRLEQVGVGWTHLHDMPAVLGQVVGE